MSSGQRLLLASIHDVSPRFETEVDRLLDLLSPHVGERIAMLVVPNHWGTSPIVSGSRFATRLRSWADAGMEMFLHGMFHRDDSSPDHPAQSLKGRFLTAGEGEFLGLDRFEAGSRINKGRLIIEDVIGRKVDGFVAPAWLYGPGAHGALADCEIAIAEDHFRVWSPANKTILARGPVITWASRTRLRLASSLAVAAALRHAPLRILRVGVHPPDVRQPALLASIDATFEAARRTRKAGAYRDLLEMGVRSAA